MAPQESQAAQGKTAFAKKEHFVFLRWIIFDFSHCCLHSERIFILTEIVNLKRGFGDATKQQETLGMTLRGRSKQFPFECFDVNVHHWFC